MIELYSNMSSNHLLDCKLAGDIFKVTSIEGIELMGILIKDGVEFTVYEVGECLCDMSYNYKE